MFGERIDYDLLKPLCHSRAIRSRMIVSLSDEDRTDYKAQVDTFLRYFDGALDIRNKAVFDVGCGNGKFSLELARHGASRVVGIDIVARQIAELDSWLSQSPELTAKVQYLHANLLDWNTAERFDLVISRAAFEHFDRPHEMLERMFSLLKPGGVLPAVFGPMFHSPYGDHMWGFFKVQLPYRGLLFNERAVLRLRREFYRPDEVAQRYQEISGGLNKMRYGAFVKMVNKVGGKVELLRPVVLPVHRRWMRLPAAGLNQIGRIPLLRDYIAVAPALLLRRADGTDNSQGCHPQVG